MVVFICLHFSDCVAVILPLCVHVEQLYTIILIVHCILGFISDANTGFFRGLGLWLEGKGSRVLAFASVAGCWGGAPAGMGQVYSRGELGLGVDDVICFVHVVLDVLVIVLAV